MTLKLWRRGGRSSDDAHAPHRPDPPTPLRVARRGLRGLLPLPALGLARGGAVGHRQSQGGGREQGAGDTASPLVHMVSVWYDMSESRQEGGLLYV